MMKKILSSLTLIFFSLFVLIGCDILKSIPTNTTGGVFSLNGSWKIESSSNDNALVGTIVNVYPIAGDGSITSLQNNSYCLRVNDILWKSITSNNGNFNISNLVNSCNNSVVYKPAVLTIITNNEIRLSGTTANNTSLIQTWKRVANK